MNTGNWITIILFGLSVGLAIYGFIYRLDKRVSKVENRCENHQAVIDSITQLNSRLDKVTSDNETFWKILGPHLAGIIHSPKSKERDALVDKFVNGDLTLAEARRLDELLNEALASNRWTGEKKLAGALLLARVRKAEEDMNDLRRSA